MNPAVLVTGANGFIGHHVCSALLAAGWSVRAAVRRGAAPSGTHRIATVSGEDLSALRTVVRGCDAVVHLAGRAHVIDETEPDPLDAFRRSNTLLTRRLAEAAVAEGVSVFVLMSSIAAVTDAGTPLVSDELTADPDTDYGKSKLEAEEALLAAAGSIMRTVALRPPMVYGEGMRGNPLRLFKHIARGLPVPAVRPPVRRSVMYVDNLADAVLACLTTPTLQGSFCVTDGAAITVEMFARHAAAALGRRPLIVPVPGWGIRTITKLQEGLRSVGLKSGLLTAAARLAQPLVVDDRRFRRLTATMPRISLYDGLERTAAWYRRESHSVGLQAHAG